ncbi:aminodeoxychorismate synthase component I [Lysobacter antibioticus]|uniref:aminodeoxychorismate synthase component I n=1 Tax=Lysobacter antibioticus TaxID=84531 RepID=UPI00034CC9E2|nr:aminodeoxychorismate synthase component I [Lysobacter antibioticus]
MRCLLIDNYDSFTWNLADLIGRAFGEAPVVVRNDEYRWPELRARGFDCAVISPGPGSPTHEADFHVSAQAIAETELPLLGVCLGFQGIAHAAGGRIVHAPEPFHGRACAVHHDGDGLFAGLPTPFQAIRYHSLIAAAPLPPALIATAHTEDGLIMALRHRQRPQWGVQFHPESILTEHGLAMIGNFRDLAARARGRAWSAPGARSTHETVESQAGATHGTAEPQARAAPEPAAQLRWRALAPGLDPQSVFGALYAARPHAFWLDSQSADEAAEHSFMGAAEAGEVYAYRVADDDAAGSAGQAWLARLDEELERTRVDGAQTLPFAFCGGFVGYFGYEMQALFGGERRAGTAAPDALWMRVRRFVAFDHAGGAAWAVAVADAGEDPADAEAWLDATARAAEATRGAAVAESAAATTTQLDVAMDLGRDDYLAAIGECRAAIVDGESYQVCLTNHFRFAAAFDPYALYRRMRRGNAAPFGAFLRSGAYSVLSTSPERFLRVDREGRIQTKPIKGTIRRAADPQRDAEYARKLADSPKDRAENLMIVDLMRNDLNRVAQPGSVEVPKLRVVESYRTVHQLVSTVEAQLRPDRSLIDLVRATFPGGSISGAPKLRTLQIIDRLERSPRGVYCGSIGYLGYHRVADLNIGIRTLSYDGREAAFGAGGAITYLSDAQAEFDEVLLKAEAVLRPVWDFLADGAAYRARLHGDRLSLSAAPLSDATPD